MPLSLKELMQKYVYELSFLKLLKNLNSAIDYLK